MVSSIGSTAAYAAYVAQKKASESLGEEVIVEGQDDENPAAVVEISEDAREALAEALADIEEEIEDQAE